MPAATEHLAPYAQHSDQTLGRVHAEEKHPYRSAYSRDRDRIIHATAFRRLEYKTQVFVNHEGDHYRTRLTHTFEVAQISRTLASALNLNESLAEAVALSHDLGHPPFGHVGETVMDRLLKDVGGFEHNAQGLRIVDELELSYPDFSGLNLSYEVREGFAKHHTTYDNPKEVSALGFAADTRPPLEVQIVNLADEMAYSTADLDDGLRAGLLTEEGLDDVALWRTAMKPARARWPGIDSRMRCRQAIRLLMDYLVTDILSATAEKLRTEHIKSIADVRACREVLAATSEQVTEGLHELGRYLMDNFYNHARVRTETEKSEYYLHGLFDYFINHSTELPESYRRRAETDDGGMLRAVGDYVAGMTDRFAVEQYEQKVLSV